MSFEMPACVELIALPWFPESPNNFLFAPAALALIQPQCQHAFNN